MSTILVTGASGQVGRELLQRARGRRVVGLARDRLDITDPDAVRRALAAHRATVVVNAAAFTAVDLAEADPAGAHAVNADGPAHLAAACAELGICLLHLSTDYVFGGTGTLPWREQDEPAPQGAYARSKRQGKVAVATLLEAHLVLRVAWLFGAHGRNFVKTILQLARDRRELRVVADQHGCPTPTRAVAETILLLADRIIAGEPIRWGTYHYCGTPAATWHGFAAAVLAEAAARGLLLGPVTAVPVMSDHHPSPAARPMNSVLDCAKIERELGIRQPDWRHGLGLLLRERRAVG
jgi:dTDP-4-dehydrorhamnose reductase